MQSTTPRGTFSRLYASNSTASSITAPAPTTTQPSGDGYFNCGANADDGQFNYVDLRFFGAGADNSTATALVLGWRKVQDASLTPIWLPVKLLALNLTFCTQVGVAGAAVQDTDRMADTIAASTAYTTAYEIISPADNTEGCVKLDAIGFDYIQVLVAKGTSTNVNATGAGF